jgi:uncharacterized membrane protein YhaH (DUF805 family)
MHWYLSVLGKYAVFEGRARREEYWMFFLFNIIISFLVGFIDVLLGGEGVIATLYLVGVLLPTLAVTVRRLHDTGRSGWWLLISLIPLIGGIVLLVFYVQDSEKGRNSFGPNPKETAG